MITRQQSAVYHSTQIQAWEKRWFAANNSSYGLMQQAAWQIFQQLRLQLQAHAKILVWCGQGNNAGDGFLLAKYLKQANYDVQIYTPWQVLSPDAIQAQAEVIAADVEISTALPLSTSDVHIDALFGIGLNRTLDEQSQAVIQAFNVAQGLKVSIDVPSGLHPNNGVPLPIAIQADITYCVVGLKLGLLTGQAKSYVGKIQVIPLIPTDAACQPLGYFQPSSPQLPSRVSHHHKGSFGHVLVIGGHPDMGGAVMMSAEAAMASGAGKLTILSATKHHGAILSRSPNVMTKDIQHTNMAELVHLLQAADGVCFGMGLGRDAWAEQNYHMMVNALKQSPILKTVVWDADALWFLASHPEEVDVQADWIFTPHSGEAARLLKCSISQIEQDRYAAIQALQQKYGGQWVLKGAGSLSLESKGLSICGLGNAGMGTAGMGDVLAGMMAALKAQFGDEIWVADVVALHAAAGDVLAEQGMRGLQAHDMPKAIQQVVNQA